MSGEAISSSPSLSSIASKAAPPPLSRAMSTLTAARGNVLREDLDKELAVTSVLAAEGEAEGSEFDWETALRVDQRRREASGKEELKRKKESGVMWRDMTVSVPSVERRHIPGVHDALLGSWTWPYYLAKSQLAAYRARNGPDPLAGRRVLLNKFSGLIKPGEMVLVLGRPQSGCSTFLRSIATELNAGGSELRVDGTLSYDGRNMKDMRKHYSGEIIYSDEDDVHNATLTVAQTLNFALDSKTPANRLPGQTLEEYKTSTLDLLLQMLNIQHTRNTIVGSALVRGLSGGERKRVSVAEALCCNSAITCWDGSTRGLDSSTALEFVKALRVIADLNGRTTFVSLYQAGESIYNLFDKVLLIDRGREVYFGPVHSARDHFMALGYAELPRQTTPDFLCGCTDVNERRFAPGRDASNVPSTPEALEAAFNASEDARKMRMEMDEYEEGLKVDSQRKTDFEVAVRDQKRKGAGKNTPYTVGFFTQVRALMFRQIRLRLQDRVGVCASFVTTTVLALILGSVYYKMPHTTQGALSRTGFIYVSLLYNSLSVFAELPNQFHGRPIVVKQKGFAFYRPAALAVANACAEIPYEIVRTMLFCLLAYWMTGLTQTAGAFFAYYLLTLTGIFCLANFFRMAGSACTKMDTAYRTTAILITFMNLGTGYFIPVSRMERWLFWIYYINPLGYMFSSLMSNEFGNISINCEGNQIVPHNIAGLTSIYPDVLGPNQACTFAGATPGSPTISGDAYLKASFGYVSSALWWHYAIVLGFALGFLAVQVFLSENLGTELMEKSPIVYQKEDKKRAELNAALQNFHEDRWHEKALSYETSHKTFTWEAVSYDVPVAGGRKTLLDDIYGYVKPGQLVALMGASGAGKTTLLDVLSCRKNIGVVHGSMLVDGKPLGRDFQRSTAYVEQQDVHESRSTVREALRFSAALRQPAHVPQSEKEAWVERVISLLDLQDVADAMIGDPGSGLGVEQRKRVTIGVELASRPQLLLFLDEPTSGLDAQSAFNIIHFLRRLAAAGQAIICTVHQPSALLFESFDRLLLLKRGGRCVYFGDIGQDASVLRGYLHRNGASCPPNANPSEFMLAAVGAGSQRAIGDKDWADVWRDSPEFGEVKVEIEALKTEKENEKGHIAEDINEGDAAALEYAVPFFEQLKWVARRATLATFRRPEYGATRVANHITIGLLSGLVFIGLQHNVKDLRYRIFAIFEVAVLPPIVQQQTQPLFILNRGTFFREASSRMYSPTVFALSQMMQEIPYSIFCSVIFFCLFYFPIGFQMAPDRAGYQYLMILVVEFFSTTMGQALASLGPTIRSISLMNPFLSTLFTLFAGVTITKPNMLPFWRAWLYPLNPFMRLVSGMAVTEMSGLEIRCTPDEYTIFDPPAGQTCQEWAGAFVQAARGYLENGAATAQCQYCQYSRGEDYLASLDISFSERWRDLGILIAFTAFNIIICILASNYLRYSKR